MSYRFRTKPFPYQMTALKQAIVKKRFALWLSPGLGKTKVAIDYCAFAHTKGEVNRVLIVCPLSVVGVWQEEIATHCPVPHTICTGPFEASIEPVLHFYITTYGYMAYIPPQRRDSSGRPLRDEKGKVIKRTWAHLSEFIRLKPDAVIIDEAHFVKGHTSDRTKAVKMLSSGREYILELTGTPQPNDPLDLYSQLDILQPGLFGTWTEFKQHHAVYDYSGFKVLKWLNIPELKAKIKPFCIRIKKEEALPDLPPRTHQRIPITLEHRQQQLYDKMKKDSYLRLSETEEVTADIVLTQYLRLQQIAGGFLRTDDKATKRIGEAKLWALEELLPTYTHEGKAIVYTVFLPELEACVELGTKLKLKPLVIQGSMSGKEREESRHRFIEEPTHKLLVMQIRAGGVGIDKLQHATSTAIFYSLSSKHDDWVQACDRIHRIGQDKPCHYLYLLAKGTIDEYIYKLLQKKQKLADLVTSWREVLK